MSDLKSQITNLQSPDLPAANLRANLEHYQKTRTMPLHFGWIRGHVGKIFIVKHYGNRKVMTKFPDMSKVIASKGQRECRDLFKDAVAFAKVAIATPATKLLWKKRLKVPLHRVFNAIIKLYMKTAKQGIRVESEIRCETINPDGSRRIQTRSYWIPLTAPRLDTLIQIP